jgi:hypothetical protein
MVVSVAVDSGSGNQDSLIASYDIGSNLHHQSTIGRLRSIDIAEST